MKASSAGSKHADDCKDSKEPIFAHERTDRNLHAFAKLRTLTLDSELTTSAMKGKEPDRPFPSVDRDGPTRDQMCTGSVGPSAR